MKRIALLLLLALFAFGGIKTVSVKATGFGTSYEEAVQNALINAIAQVKGIDIRAKKSYKKRLTQIAFRIDGKGSGKISIDDTTRSSVYTATGGFVQSFRILRVKRLGPNEYRAVVRAYFSSYKAPGHNPRKRRTLAVLPFAYKASYNLNGVPIRGKALSQRLAQAIINKITQTRKFTVLDRQNSAYYDFERRFLLDPGSDPQELARIGKRLGADYFVIGEILDFGAGAKEANALIGISEGNEGYATINYRILSVPYQQIKWSDTIDVEFELPKTRRAESLITKASDTIAQILVSQIMFNIYPPKIVGHSGAKAIVNIGSNFIHTGDRFKVYRLGKKLYDPYTKEFLGRDEIEVGEVEIIKVLPKISYAKKVWGKAPKGAILRPSQKEEASTTQEGKESMYELMFSN